MDIDMVGQTISHYKILEKLGEGGMGVVYKAQDLKLDRTVALKFLPTHISPTDQERARFLQEAKAAAALNHPNISTIHGIEEHDDQMFIVMEFVDGATLREKFGASPMLVKDAVAYALQISEALQEAHSKGIIHRDVKADNMMVNSKNQVKVMDFGLAKLKGSLKLTKATSTVGTLGYMAPEQIQGAEADARSDIFSFGVLLFEILTGRLPFHGEHEAAMVYSIVNEEPESLNKYRGDVPNDLQHIILRCLEKDPEDRYQHAEEIVRELHRIQKQSSRAFKTTRAVDVPTSGEIEAAPSPPIQRIKSSWTMLAALVVLALISTIVLLVLKKEPAETMGAEVKIMKFTSLPGLEDEPTWSPDGKFLAYTADDRGNFDIIVQPLAGGQVIHVADSDADDAQPAWSPDGSKLAFVSARDRGGRFSILFGQGLLETYLKGKGGDIFLVPSLGGRPVKLVSNGFDPAWSLDGKTIVYRSVQGGQWDLWTVPAEGGTPKQLTNDIDFDYQPSWSPDGRWILYSSGVVQSGYEVRVLPASGGTPKILTNDKAMVVKPAWSSDGKAIIFSSNRKGSMNIWKLPFYPDSKELVVPVRITVGEGDDINISAASAGSTIAFATVKTSPDIWEFKVKSGKLRQVSFETSMEDQPSISPDGKTLIVTSNRGGTDQLWTMDLNGKFLSQLTSDSNVPFPMGSWSPDGKEVLRSSTEQEKGRVVVRSLGEVSPKKVIEDANFASWSPDGKTIAFVRVDTVRKKQDVWIHVLETGEEKQLTSLEWNCVFLSWSPDRNWITFNVVKKNTREIWVIPSSGGRPRQVLASDVEYSHPQWSPRDMDVILCLKDHKNICLVSVSTGRVKQITNITESSVNLIDFPSWSRDGEKVYFSLFRKSGDVFVLENY